MRSLRSLPLWLLGSCLFLDSAPAQSSGLSWCHTGTSIGFGRALDSGPDGSGGQQLVVGGPGNLPFFPQRGRVRIFGGNSYQGNTDTDLFGFSVATGIDLDGDGASDVLAGAPGDDDGGTDAGSVSALSGGSVLYRVDGLAAGDGLGHSLCALQDLNGDGVAEFLVGAISDADTGYVQVLSGIDGTLLRTHSGTAGDRFGHSLARLGDLNGDGVIDYAIGAPASAGAGTVFVYSGSDGALLRTHSGSAAGEEFGASVSGGADIDRDGVQEVLIGSPHGGLASGEVRAFSGTDGSLVFHASEGAAYERFGAAVAGLRDFDGDGFGDVGVGAPGSLDPNGYPSQPGRALVLSGRTGESLGELGGGWSGCALGIAIAAQEPVDGLGLSALIAGGIFHNDGYGESACVQSFSIDLAHRTSRAQEPDSRRGTSLARVDDLNGDGRSELMIGDPAGRNALGEIVGSVRVETQEGELLFAFHGVDVGDRLGEAVACAGDMNGDGVADLAAGAANKRGGQGGGYARVYSGADGSLLHHFQGPGDNLFGGELAGGRDLDADGFDDLLIGGVRFETLRGNLDGFIPWSTNTVRAYSGQSGLLLHEFSGQDALGASLVMLDDLDADGHDDFAMGIPERNIQGPPIWTLGEIEFRSGRTGALLGTWLSYYFRNGTDLARLDDLDGDGLGDLAVTSWDPAFWSMGSLHAVSTGTFTELWMVEQSTFYEGLTFGYSVASGPSGSGSLVVGNPGTSLNAARAVGTVELRSQSGGQLLATEWGYSGWDYLGYSVAHLGDVDGDGQADWAAGAPTEPDNATAAEPGQSRAQIFFSSGLRKYNFCRLTLNSTGAAAQLQAQGSSSVSQNELQLLATGLPDAFGLFVAGPTAVDLPFLAGRQCVGNITRLSPVLPIAAGGLNWDVDLASSPGDTITAGSTWNFQAWFRDPVQIANTSDAVHIQFLP